LICYVLLATGVFYVAGQFILLFFHLAILSTVYWLVLVVLGTRWCFPGMSWFCFAIVIVFLGFYTVGVCTVCSVIFPVDDQGVSGSDGVRFSFFHLFLFWSGLLPQLSVWLVNRCCCCHGMASYSSVLMGWEFFLCYSLGSPVCVIVIKPFSVFYLVVACFSFLSLGCIFCLLLLIRYGGLFSFCFRVRFFDINPVFLAVAKEGRLLYFEVLS